MGKITRLSISPETIEVFSNFIKINSQLWITSGFRQSVLTPYSASHFLTGLIKDNIPEKPLTNWDGERGFGIYDGSLFVKALKEVKSPVLDFSNIKETLIILDARNPKKKIEIEVVGPDEVKRIQKNQKMLPEKWDLEVNFGVGDISQMRDMGKEIEVSKIGKGHACYKNIDSNKGMKTENIIESYSPKDKAFRFTFQTERLLMPKGNYQVSFSVNGISQWTNLSDRKYIFYMVLGKGGFVGKPKPSSAIIPLKPYKPLKKISAKEYTDINSLSRAIQTTWRKGVDAIFETGELLGQAKNKFSKNEFTWQQFLNTLPFSIDTMNKLILIARHKPMLIDDRIYNNLPPNYSTIYEICTTGKDKPIITYENDEGESSPVKKKGFNEITLTKKDLILRALNEQVSKDGKKVPLLRNDMPRKDWETFKRKIDTQYFPEKKKLQTESENKETVYFVKFKPKTPKKEVEDFESKLDKLVKNNPYITIRKTK
jgi:hypothetical protein